MHTKVLSHFKISDPVLYAAAVKVGVIEPIKKDNPSNYFSRLCREIICQQLSNKAGETIFGRFKKLFSRRTITARDILPKSPEDLRASGMSNAKARYVRNLAEHVIHGRLRFSKFDSMSDDEIRKELLQVKGIGPWTCEMFLMFVMAREDVFSSGDLGLRKGLMKIYKMKTEPSKKKVEEIAAKWSPYKTYASRILWASLEV